MNRLLLTGTALLTLLNVAVPAGAARKHVTDYYPALIQLRWVGSGARVDEVDSNSPAARAGVRPGDRIVGINGRTINSISDVIPFVESGGRPLTVDLERGGTRVRVRVSPPNGRWQRGVLGITGTEHRYHRSDDTYIEPPPFQPPPIPPDPPMPPFIPNPN